MAIRGYLFDLDGTLVDSERETAEAMARALLRGQGITVDELTPALVDERDAHYGSDMGAS
jgi:beta-phosphoglucomutase-like phosphatase (HAD superfamily)